jgi:hypothetical protein
MPTYGDLEETGEEADVTYLKTLNKLLQEYNPWSGFQALAKIRTTYF